MPWNSATNPAHLSPALVARGVLALPDLLIDVVLVHGKLTSQATGPGGGGAASIRGKGRDEYGRVDVSAVRVCASAHMQA